MELISQIINELMDTSVRLESALLKTKALATRIDNTALLNWIDGELFGFKNDVPAYRKANCQLIGSYVNGHHQLTKQAIPLTFLKPDEAEFLREVYVKDSISAIEKRELNQGGKNIQFAVSGEVQNYIERTLMQQGNERLFFTEMHLLASSTLFSNILTTVRGKLLEFILKIDVEFGPGTEIKALKTKNDQITTIMNTTINNSGNGNIISTGSRSHINSSMVFYENNIEHLKNILTQNKVSEEDLNELITFLKDVPTTQENVYPELIATWMKKMMNKAIDGSWDVGLGAAGGILADAISVYFGWNK